MSPPDSADPTGPAAEQQVRQPRGHGLLGVMLRAGRSLRIPDMSQDARRVGFPPPPPAPMTSLLGVPIFVRGNLVGDLYLTDKIGGPEFSEADEWIVELLATHTATALTNAQLPASSPWPCPWLPSVNLAPQRVKLQERDSGPGYPGPPCCSLVCWRFAGSLCLGGR